MTDLLTILIFGGVAVFLGLRLYSVLGQDDGQLENPGTSPQRSTDVLGQRTQSHLRPAFEGPAAAGLEDIASADTGFDPHQFIEGSRSAYSMIVQAFASGDKDALRSLLSGKVFDRYSAAIDAREERKETVKTEIDRISKAEIVEASQTGNLASVKVRFHADMATETLDKYGVVIAGSLEKLTHVGEDWVFERHTDNSDPNWVLASVATA
jgi:predicted lipid-binding transport protein (Tim44 family)